MNFMILPNMMIMILVDFILNDRMNVWVPKQILLVILDIPLISYLGRFFYDKTIR